MVYLVQKLEVPYESADVWVQETVYNNLEAAQISLSNQIKQAIQQLMEESNVEKTEITLVKNSESQYYLDVTDLTTISFKIQELPVVSDCQPISLKLELEDFLN